MVQLLLDYDLNKMEYEVFIMFTTEFDLGNSSFRELFCTKVVWDLVTLSIRADYFAYFIVNLSEALRVSHDSDRQVPEMTSSCF